MIAVKDFGGSGPPILLLHGTGGSSEDWNMVAEPLTESFSVIAADLPGHGASPALDTWAFRSVLDALAELDLDNPAVVGMSLGGMLAVHWGAEHPGCPGVVSLDGHRPPVTSPANYRGLPADRLADLRSRLQESFDAMLTAVPGDQAATFAEISEAMAADDVVPLLGAIRCPTTVGVAMRDLPGTEAFAELLAAFRRGLIEDLTAAATSNHNLTIVEVPASHAMHRESPAEVAEIVQQALHGLRR